MRIHIVVVVAAVAGIGLAGCAGDTKQAAHSLGLTAGTLPAPQSFVVDARGAQPTAYPPVGTTPPARSDRVLSQDERKALEASLLATPGRTPSPQEVAANAKAAKKKPKLVSARKGQSFQPPK